MGVIYLGILFCSIAFAVVVVYICLVLKRVSTTMEALGTTLGEVEKKFESITPEIKSTVQATEEMVDDMEVKLKATDSLFDTMENVGSSVNSMNHVYKQNREKLTNKEFRRKLTPFIEGIKWSEAAFLLYSKWKKKQQTDKNELMIQDENTEMIPYNQTGSRDNI
ncbi:DUF948 domain-containing protein [Virgibacillus sp. NKC19-16]|uniref:DUF948 domain-containing protein n=1 Tax=Virgibacillus salidurans TaxID=2831673 RepID=UPI001F2E25A9|nr:DUF948 domain-containing protein [Virgibacillus sp. NKC19-16]UJL46591.1 DUF948 domain-containing protein [Virgibacillus sp. NKC19-16]